MTRRDTRKYALNVLKARANVRKAAKEATAALAMKLGVRYSKAVINPNYYATVTIVP